jgi:uncharacterized SAM-binding protein YcdF (DUF218 family)
MKRVSPSIRWRLARRALAVLAGSWLLSLVLVLFWQRRDSRAPSRAIVVLGAAQYAGHPSPVLRARVDHAIGLFQSGFSGTIVFTGGIASGDTTSEAAVARRYAIANGVPDSVILVETQSRSTSEALRNVASLLRGGPRDVILVSDPFHMLRLSILASRFGLQPRTSPTRTSPISSNRIEFWRYALQESWKVPAALLFEFPDRR